jgi:hypothetical protein
MNCMLDKAIKEIDRQLQFLSRTDSRELHLRAYETAARIGVPEPYVWQRLREWPVRVRSDLQLGASGFGARSLFKNGRRQPSSIIPTIGTMSACDQ